MPLAIAAYKKWVHPNGGLRAKHGLSFQNLALTPIQEFS